MRSGKKSMKEKAIEKFVSASLAGILLLAGVSCGGGEISGKVETLNASYSLFSAALDGEDRTEDFQAYTAVFRPDGSLRVTIGYLGAITKRDSTYTFDGKTATERYRGETFLYEAEGDTLTTQMKDFEDMFTVVLKKDEGGNVQREAVDFESVLFGPDMADSKIFNYCPAILTETEENGDEVMHIWYCTNKDDGVIMDHIGYRKGIRQTSGKWLFGEQKIVLQPTEGTWDARHTCDPAVIRGKFKMRGVTYGYLMAYLGCVTEDYSNNETGIAVAQNPEGPWIKVDSLNPIEPWADECKPGSWGTGMPALVSIDQKGEALLFYQSSARGTGIERWDFSDLDKPELKAKFTVSIGHNGIVNSQGIKCNIGIPDFAYDPAAKRFYVCGVTNEKNPPDVTKTLVNSHSMVAYLENVENMEALCQILQSGGYTWKTAGYVGPADTGFERNHNPGLVRDAYGYIPDSSKIGLVVSTGRNSWGNENIFTYRLHGAYVKIS